MIFAEDKNPFEAVHKAYKYAVEKGGWEQNSFKANWYYRKYNAGKMGKHVWKWHIPMVILFAYFGRYRCASVHNIIKIEWLEAFSALCEKNCLATFFGIYM